MKVDLDGLAANIKSCIDPKKDRGGWAYMVDEMVQHIKELESAADQHAKDLFAMEGMIREVIEICENTYDHGTVSNQVSDWADRAKAFLDGGAHGTGG